MYTYDETKQVDATLVALGLEDNARQVQIATMAEVYPLFARLEDWMRALDYPPRDVFAVRLAVHEAVANAVRHGNGSDPSKSVRIRYLVRPAEVLIEVSDQGPGFNPVDVPDPLLDENLGKPSGRGVFLMRAYSTWVNFNLQGNQVTLCRRRSET